MSTKLMDRYVEKMFDKKVIDIEKANDIFERDFFSKNYYRIPSGEILRGMSFNDNMEKLKAIAKEGRKEDLDAVFESLRDFFFFSAGNDMIYRKKLEADSYRDVPIKEIILPLALEEVHNKYGDDILFHPERRVVIQFVDNTLNNAILISTFLYFLYCDDFIPTKNMKKKFPSSCDRITKKLGCHSITIGDYLNYLVKLKCDKIRCVFADVQNEELKSEILERVAELQRSKMIEISQLYNANLHICYFFNHSVYEFVNNSLDGTNKTYIK